MTTGSSTLRSPPGSTFNGQPKDIAPALQSAIELEWQQSGNADLVVALHRHPQVLRNQSLLLNLAIREFQARCPSSASVDLERHCSRFREFGGSIESLIFRQLDVQRVLEDRIGLVDPLREPDWPKVGEAFGKFHVIEELGRGSLARVYLCLQCDLGNRPAVIKAAFHADLEASILGKLDHPNITPIHSTGYVEESDLYYLCMPYRGRSTLVDLLDLAFEHGFPRTGHLAAAASRWSSEESVQQKRGWYQRISDIMRSTYLDEVLDISIAIADALSHAHRNRILHGDLKPSNVLLSPQGQPLLLDFNLSQDFGNSRRQCGGTLPYMPPEHLQFVASGAQVDTNARFDPGSDIFSFGALLYELITGKSPLKLPKDCQDPRQIARQFLDEYKRGLQPLRSKNRLISARLESVVHSCLAFERNQRPATIHHVRQVLRQERGWRSTWVRRARTRPLACAIIAVAVACSLASAATLYWAQPPKFEADYAAGIVASQSGDFSSAVTHFDDALRQNPSFDAARFERGRAHAKSREVDLAMQDFGQLALRGDPKAMAMLGYCFNLNNFEVAAIAWYERAIEKGADSVAINNNLGASYLVVPTHRTLPERLQRAEQSLQEALSGAPQSMTVRLNIVRLATEKSATDPSFDPSGVWRHAYALLMIEAKDRMIESDIDAWYKGLLRFAQRSGKGDMSLEKAFGVDAVAVEALAALDQKLLSSPTSDSKEGATQHPGDPPSNFAELYFLEPFDLD